jgi:hypothetical protein
MYRFLLPLALALACVHGWAQDITAEEQAMLDRVSADFKAKGIELTPEQEVRFLQRMRAMKALANGVSSSGIPPAAPATRAPLAPRQQDRGALPEADLKARLQALPTAARATDLRYERDGIEVDGHLFADPEGRIERWAVDPATSTVGYLVRSAGSELATFKIGRLAGSDTAVMVGRVQRTAEGVRFESATGQVLAGEQWLPLTDGALVLRQSVAFRWVVGVGTQQIDIPNGWRPAPLQRGNVSTTGWLLLERASPPAKATPLNLVAQLGKVLALTEANDYALFHMQSGRLVLVDVNADDKTVHQMSQCRRKSAMVNVCDQMNSYQSIWEPDGGPNSRHYFWRIDWQQTAAGAVMVALEHGLQQVNAYALDSGKKVNLFERTLGIAGIAPSLVADGRYQLAARGVGGGSIADVAAELESRPALQPAH